jgi:hypothetical protein
MTNLPSPPGKHLTSLPRSRGEKPQETDVAINPLDPNNVVVSFHQAVGDGSDHHENVRVEARAAWSTDGGRTWTVGADASHPAFRCAIDVSTAFDARGRVYLAYIGMNEMTSDTRSGEYVRRSLDGGRTWEPPVTLVEREAHESMLEHMPNLVADVSPGSPHNGNVYVVWDRQTFQGDPASPQIKHSELVLARSTDGGETWSEPLIFGRYDSGFAHATGVGHDGTVFVMCGRLGAEIELVLFVSRDGGSSFGAALPVVNTGRGFPSPADFPRSGGWPFMAVGGGRLYVAWSDDRSGSYDVYVTGSGDDGATWSEPVRANERDGSAGDVAMHWLAVDQTTGDAYVLFYDRRGDPENRQASVTVGRSVDGGRTWDNYAFDDKLLDPMQASLGDYLGIAARDGKVVAAWVENIPDEPQAANTPGPWGVLWPWSPSSVTIGLADFTNERRRSE